MRHKITKVLSLLIAGFLTVSSNGVYASGPLSDEDLAFQLLLADSATLTESVVVPVPASVPDALAPTVRDFIGRVPADQQAKYMDRIDNIVMYTAVADRGQVLRALLARNFTYQQIYDLSFELASRGVCPARIDFINSYQRPGVANNGFIGNAADAEDLSLALARQLQAEEDRAAGLLYGANNNNNNNNNNVPALPNTPVTNLIPAIGEVRAYTGQRYHCGTGTLIEKGAHNIIVSATHIFHSVLPNRESLGNVRTGPLFIDLRQKNVTWTYQPNENMRGAQEIPVLGMVVLRQYIDLLTDPNSRGITEEQQQYDITFLLLAANRMPQNVPVIPLANQLRGFSSMCALYGYGQLATEARPGRHHIALRFEAPELGLDPTDVLRIRVDSTFPDDLIRARRELQYLLCKPQLNDHRDGIASGSPPGDSGGPCLIVTPEGVRVIGVLSVYGVRSNTQWLVDHQGRRHNQQVERYDYNGAASLIAGEPGQVYTLSPVAVAMLTLLKQQRLG